MKYMLQQSKEPFVPWHGTPYGSCPCLPGAWGATWPPRHPLLAPQIRPRSPPTNANPAAGDPYPDFAMERATPDCAPVHTVAAAAAAAPRASAAAGESPPWFPRSRPLPPAVAAMAPELACGPPGQWGTPPAWSGTPGRCRLIWLRSPRFQAVPERSRRRPCQWRMRTQKQAAVSAAAW